MQTVHSMAPIIGEEPRVLILGSMPGVESLRRQQYYAHPRNHFWPILYGIFGEVPDPDYEDRAAFLKAHGFALWDVIRTCRRKGSADGSIRDIEVNPVAELLRDNPGIRLVILNGSTAYDAYKRHVMNGNPDLPRAVKAPSTSPIPGRNVKTYAEKLQVWKRLIAEKEASHGDSVDG